MRFLLRQLFSTPYATQKTLTGHCRVRTHRDLALLPDMGSLLLVEIARVDVIVVEHVMCPTYGGNEMKG